MDAGVSRRVSNVLDFEVGEGARHDTRPHEAPDLLTINLERRTGPHQADSVQLQDPIQRKLPKNVVIRCCVTNINQPTGDSKNG